jgi:hypothetical protein
MLLLDKGDCMPHLQGRRGYMEDLIVTSPLPASAGLVDWEGDSDEDLEGAGAGVFAVLDGHGGIEAAEWYDSA